MLTWSVCLLAFGFASSILATRVIPALFHTFEDSMPLVWGAGIKIRVPQAKGCSGAWTAGWSTCRPRLHPGLQLWPQEVPASHCSLNSSSPAKWSPDQPWAFHLSHISEPRWIQCIVIWLRGQIQMPPSPAGFPCSLLSEGSPSR